MLVRSRIKPYLIFTGAVVLIAAGAYFWGLRSSMLGLEKEAQANIQKAKDFDVLNAELEKQKSECEKYLAKQEINVEQYNFCRKFVDWANTLKPANL